MALVHVVVVYFPHVRMKWGILIGKHTTSLDLDMQIRNCLMKRGLEKGMRSTFTLVLPFLFSWLNAKLDHHLITEGLIIPSHVQIVKWAMGARHRLSVSRLMKGSGKYNRLMMW